VGDKLRIMGIYAHPADVATEAAGTMAIHADRGDELTAIVLSDGIRMHPHLLTVGAGAASDERVSQEEYAEFKRNEVRRAARILGIATSEFMAWDADFFNATDARVEELARVIVRHRPDVILTHYPVGPHLIDSNAFAGIYATRAMHLATTLIPRVDGVEPHFVKELYFFLMDQSMDTRSKIDTPGIVADFFVDTTAVIGRKVQAFDQYVSQGYEGAFARKVVEARDGRHGMHAEASYAEPFLFSRSVTFDGLPVSRRVRDSTYVANNLPGDQLLAHLVPSATPPEAYRIRP
jgi:LmbE family N-acetylglucosaminyl deacetylase